MIPVDETGIRRKSHRYHVRRLTSQSASTELMVLQVEAPAIDLRRLVVVRYVDFRTGYHDAIGGVVKFSRKGETPEERRNIRLATPSDFRDGGYEPGIADDLDSAQRADMAPYLARQMSGKGGYVSAADVSASMTFTVSREPWVYCTSIAPNWSYDDGALRREFAESKGSDAAITAIEKPDQFARRLGIELALGVEVGWDAVADNVTGPMGPLLARLWCGLDTVLSVETVVCVNHGPVHYEDTSLVIETQSDMPTMEGLRACFTKRMEFRGQREYRFAVQVAGGPLRRAIYVETSGELLRWTKRLAT